MFKITIKNIIRSFLKYLNVSIINLSGLVLAFTVFIYIGHYVLYEKSFDTFWEGQERIYRVANVTTNNGEVSYNGAKSPRGIFYSKSEIPEVEACGFSFFECNQVKREPHALFDQKMLWVTDGFQEVFHFEMKEGQADFARKCTGIISENKAKVLFGNKSPIGEILSVNEGFKIEITGVFKDVPANTHLDADYYCSWASWAYFGWMQERPDWNWPGFWTYLKLKEGADPSAVEKKLADLVEVHLPNLEKQKRTVKFSLQPLDSIHFDNSKKGDYGKKVDQSSLIFLVLFGVFILVVAWINYVNLSTALAIKKERTIGIQKLVGAGKRHQLTHVLLENFIFNVLAAAIAGLIFWLTKQGFSSLFNIPLDTSYIPKHIFAGWFILILIVGLIASSAYSGFSILKINPFSRKALARKGKMQKGLVIAQLCVTIIFMSMSILVYKQIKFAQEYNLGMKINDVVVLSGPTSFNGQMNANGLENPKFGKFRSFRDYLLKYPEIEAGSALSDLPGQEMFRSNTFFTRPGTNLDITTPMGTVEVEDNIVETMGLKILAGSDFSGSKSDFYRTAIISKKALNILGFSTPEEAIGSAIQTHMYGSLTQLKIAGVVEDFHFEGLRKQIHPIVFTYGHPTEYGYYPFRINTSNIQETIALIRQTWKEFYPDDPFNCFFQDEFFNRQYESDHRLAKFNILFALLSVLISSLGLYGIILFYIGGKRKEIGIRKVNGAPIVDILIRLNKHVFIWQGIAMLIAIPLSIYLMRQWLENFVYKTDISWWVFILVGIQALIIALITVSWQSWKAATRNPVEALRYE